MEKIAAQVICSTTRCMSPALPLGVPIFAAGEKRRVSWYYSAAETRVLPQKERIVEHLRNAARELNGFLA